MIGYSHYNYLNDHLDLFWQKVFGKNLLDSYCAGIIDAHGDKGYDYKKRWEETGINFYHGMMLFMLTYTEVMDRPKHESTEWIIENYEKYRFIIAEVEEDVGVMFTLTDEERRYPSIN